MSSHGWTNDSTWGVAGACDNTSSFQGDQQTIAGVARLGMTIAAADQLRDAVVSKKLDATLPSWVDLAEVDWLQLVQSWALEDA